jgi:hypothetical protein
MITRKSALIALLATVGGFLVAERMFLASLRDSVIHDDQKIAEFLKTLSYPIKIRPSFGFCKEGGQSWGYTYQICVYSGSTPPSCPSDSYLLQYLGPQGMLSLFSKGYHDSELQFRVPIVTIDKDGDICADRRDNN